MKCNRCNKEHDGSFGSGKYCSKSCANSRGPRSEEFKNKVRSKLKGREPPNKGREMVNREIRLCLTCGEQFKVNITSNKIYCTGKCNPQWGGYREGSGKAKSGYYKGIYCGSTYELVWVIYQIDHNISFKRYEGILEGDGIKYIPDFLIENIIYEMKGFESIESVNSKTNLAISKGYDVKVLRKEQLAKEFEWVKNNYHYKRLEQLYDNHKPKFVYECSNCKSTVEKFKEIKTDTVFCNRKCSGQYRAKIKHGAMV